MCRSSRAGRRFFARPVSDHAAALTGRFASRQQQTAGTPGEIAAAFGAASRDVSSRRAAGFLSAAKEPRTARPNGGHIMNADQLKTLTTDALDKLAALLDEGHSDRLTALLKTMGRFHRY